LTFGSSEAQGLGRSGSIRGLGLLGEPREAMINPGTLLDDGIGVASEVERLDAGQAAREYATNLPPNVGRGGASCSELWRLVPRLLHSQRW
jgi:hypothetical protein